MLHSWLLLPLAVVAQAPAGDAGESRESGWQKLFKVQVRDWEIAASSMPEEHFELVVEPILRWSQPIRGGDDGAVFLWRDADGRPAVIGTLFIWPHPSGHQGVSHELHSLRTGPLSGRWGETVRWNVEDPGVAWRPIPGAPPPPDSPTQRLRRMRSLAEGFTASSTDDDGRDWPLRLLPRPVYQYEVEGPQPAHGAVFAFVQGTDAEVILLIESRGSSAGPRWEYALARMSDLILTVTHGDDEVWSVPRAGYNEWTKPYVCANVEVRRSPDELVSEETIE